MDEEKKYQLLKDYESPCLYRYAGMILTEKEWVESFVGLCKGDCEIKKDWFKEVDNVINLDLTIDELVEGYNNLNHHSKQEFICRIVIK